jgi:ferrous iron transport protein B
MVVLVIYLLVVNVANAVAAWMNRTLWIPVETGIDSIVTIKWLNDFLIGDYGFLSLGLANAFLTVLPILTVFFFAFNILEDIGYIPNLCVLTKRIFEKIGLSGSAILPITLAFGCKTMATLTTKTLRSKKERFISIYLIAFGIPCAAQMALNISILGRLGVKAFIIAFSVLGLLWISAGAILNKILKEENKDFFLQELPIIRLPNLKAVLRKTCYKLLWFLREALPVFISAAIILFIMDKIGLLDAIKRILRPVITGFLGFPIQMVDVLILCMAKHEAAAGMLIKLIQQGRLSYVQCIVAVTITMMFVPCLANIMAMVKQLAAKKAVLMVIMINITAILVAGILNWGLVICLGR